MHDVRRHHLGKILMGAQEAEVVQSLIISLFNILDVSVIISRLVFIFALVHHQAVEKRHGRVEFARLEIGIAHVELHLLRLVVAEGGSVGLFINGQSLLVLLFLEQMIGIQKVGVPRPSAARVVVHELYHLCGTIGMVKIERTDRLVILRIHATLLLWVVGQSPILRKRRQSRAIFLIPEQQNAFVEKGFGIVFFYMLLR